VFVSSSPISEQIERIAALKQQRNAVILAHYYQEGEIQDVADFIGDSLELSRKAAATTADVIVFCGVHFMAETAKILSPDKTVLLPDLNAGCSLADGCTPEQFGQFRAQYPNHVVISYINCSAAIKAQSDLICTSSNAVAMVESVPKSRGIVFAPDQNLGRWVEKQTDRELVLWPGSCVVHETFSEEAVLKLKAAHSEAEVIAHPECQNHLLDLADFIGSTSKLLAHSHTSSAPEFIVLTEPGILHQMRKAMPEKVFHEVPGLDGCSCNACPYMRLNSLEKLENCLINLSPSIKIEEDLRLKALAPIKKMLELSK
jgi:quinolinate synthase